MYTGERELWTKIAGEIEISVSRANYATWFKNVYIMKIEDDCVYLAVPNAFAKEWISNKYHKMLLKSLRDTSPNVKSLDYVIQKEDDRRKMEERAAQQEAFFGSQMAMNDMYASKEDNLNPRYTFETLIIGSFNELAHAAARQVAKSPGRNYNPLYIYGSTGLGKTHLIQSIGNEIKKTDKTKKIHYISSEKFAIDINDAMRNNKWNNFKEKYRSFDLLIIDDIQFISGKEKFQDELFHLFNIFHQSGRQIVFSSDKPPKQIEKLEERLRSRMEGGMMVDISRPEFEARVAILESKAKKHPFFPEIEVLEYVASSISESIRELEGALNIIMVQSQLKNRNLSVLEVKNLLKNNIRQQRTVSSKDVIKTIADFYNIDERVLCEKTRRKEVVRPRQIIMYILREDFNASYPHIGQKLGGRDHTTVIHAYEKIKGDLKEDSLLKNEIEQIRSILSNEQPVNN